MGVLEDLREHPRGSADWHFKLTLWCDKGDKDGNLRKFDEQWQRRREELPGVQREKSKKTQPTPTRYEDIPFSGVVEFVGRETELQKLHRLLRENQQVAIAAIAGMAGVGKTELALQYANSHRVTYQGGICWLSALQDVGVQLVQFAMNKLQLNIPEDLDLAARVKFCLTKWHQGEVLLVIDNVTNYREEVRCYLESVPARFKQLITTREKLQPPIVRLDLDVLTPRAAMQLLKSIVGRERFQSRYSEAESLYQQALALRCKLLGEEHPDVAQSLHNLAGLYNLQSRYSEAEPFAIQALALYRKLLGYEHPFVVQSLNNLALIYTFQSKYSEAELLYIQALDIFERRLGANHPNTAAVRQSLEDLRDGLN